MLRIGYSDILPEDNAIFYVPNHDEIILQDAERYSSRESDMFIRLSGIRIEIKSHDPFLPVGFAVSSRGIHLSVKSRPRSRAKDVELSIQDYEVNCLECGEHSTILQPLESQGLAMSSTVSSTLKYDMPPICTLLEFLNDPFITGNFNSWPLYFDRRMRTCYLSHPNQLG